MSERFSICCPWCEWSFGHAKPGYVASKFVMHALYQHDLWPNLDQVELMVTGQEQMAFPEMKPKQRRPGDDRPWHEIRGASA